MMHAECQWLFVFEKSFERLELRIRFENKKDTSYSTILLYNIMSSLVNITAEMPAIVQHWSERNNLFWILFSKGQRSKRSDLYEKKKKRVVGAIQNAIDIDPSQWQNDSVNL